ncbi:MAG: glutamate 5-kinase [Planctomycetes bacterium]|nr:glutamate 5-kinase [Planctomycetota bacterium]
MSSNTQYNWAEKAKRVVVKIGSRVLVDKRGNIDDHRLTDLVRQMADLRRAGKDVICVSSGAVAAGLSDLGLDSRPSDLPSLQAAAATGQARLIERYRRLFQEYNQPVAQVLLTHTDLSDRERHLNARNTFSRLLDSGVVPIVNENDTVVVDELRFGDNDILSALVACLVRADVLILLTNTDGLLKINSNGQPHELIEKVEQITEKTLALAGKSDCDLSTGGMKSKLHAAAIVTQAGEWAVIANGKTDDVLIRIFAGDSLGTTFEPKPEKLTGRKRWIAFFDHPRGDICIDKGAVDAISSKQRSLLAVGMKDVNGKFDRGAVVRILDESGAEIARGLVNYPSEELRLVVGCRTDEIAEVLGSCEYEEVVHRDNLVVR